MASLVMTVHVKLKEGLKMDVEVVQEADRVKVDPSFGAGMFGLRSRSLHHPLLLIHRLPFYNTDHVMCSTMY